jgi:subfamily B ATP-binding cassette protein MsbA
VNALWRLWGSIWPQRQRLGLSILAAIAAASFWAASLTLAFPIVKVLLDNKSLHQYVREEIDRGREDQARLRERIAALESQPAADASRFAREASRRRIELRTVEGRLFRLAWVDAWVIPWLPVNQFAEFSLILLTLAMMTALKGACEYAQETLVGGVVERTLMQMRERLLRRTLKLDCQTLALEGTPQLMARFTYDLNQLSQGLSLLGSKVVVEPLKAAMCIVGAFAVNWRLTLLSLLCLPAAAAALQLLGKRLKRSSRRQMETMGDVYQVLEETLSSFRVVQAFGNERLHRRRFHLANKAYFRRAYQILRLDAFSNPTMEFLATCAVFLALAPGAYLVLRQKSSLWGIQLAVGQLEIAELALLYTLLAGVLDPVRKLSSVYSKLKKASAAAERIFSWMDRKSLVDSPAAPTAMPRHQRSIEFERIRFHYAAGDSEARSRPPALDNVTLTIPFGAAVAVVGENGSGKSTLVQLLLRFFDPQQGTVRIDGVDLRTVDLRELRSQIGYVSQETMLFDGTIADNIRYGRPSATSHDVEQAARLAHVTAFSDHLPLKLQTPVGDKGSRLSGGQRQRVALARAMIRKPPIMILDEATSAIDSQSEQLIYQSLNDFSRGRTTFVITHRMTPELLQFVSLVVVLQRGKIMAVGPHESLLRTCPLYQRLAQTPRFTRAA